MRFRTVALIGTACTAAALLAHASRDEDMQAHAQGFAKTIERAQLAINNAVRGTAELPPVLSGTVRVIDGRTLHYLAEDLRVQIAGIEICNQGQLAYFDGTPWPCDTMATAWLVSQTLGRTVDCQRLDRRSDGVIFARCGVDGADIAGEAIVAGHALASNERRGGVPLDVYRELEDQAREARTGLWSSSFTDPQEVRQARFDDNATQVRQIEIPSSREPETVLTGEVRIIDGDTFDLGNNRIRLWGIDAPERDDAMGPRSTDHLRDLLTGRTECRPTGDESGNRLVARCALENGSDVAAAMVADGWAIDWPSYSEGFYANVQADAVENERGMFAEGVEPWR